MFIIHGLLLPAKKKQASENSSDACFFFVYFWKNPKKSLKKEREEGWEARESVIFQNSLENGALKSAALRFRCSNIR